MFVSNTRSTLLFLSSIALFLYLHLFRLPFTPFLIEGDHAVHLSNAWRMFQGEAAFRDFFLFTFPGTEIFYLSLFKIFGVEIYLLNATIFFILMGLSAIGLYFSRQVLSGSAVYLPISIFIVIGFRTLGIHGSHRYFSVLAVMAAFAILFTQRTFLRLIAAGALCGIASCFTQPRGLVGIAAIFLFLIVEKFYRNQTYAELFKSIICLLIPFTLVLGFISLYFIVSAGYDTYYFATFVFPVKHYPADIWNNPRAYFKDVPLPGSIPFTQYVRLAAPALFTYFLIPFVYVLAFGILWFKRHAFSLDTKLKLIYINLAGLFLALGTFSSPTSARLYQVSMFGVISLVWIYQYFFDFPKVTSAFLIVLGFLGFSYVVQRQTTDVNYLDTPSGNVAALSPEVFSRYQWIGQHTRPNDFLYEAHDSSLYMIFQLRNPTPMPMIRPNNYTSVEQIDEVIKGLKRNPTRYIVWNGVWEKLYSNQSPDFHLEPLIIYLRENYHRTENILDDFEGVNGAAAYQTEIWERNEPLK